MKLQIRQQWFWWVVVLGVVIVCFCLVLTIQVSLARWAVGKVTTSSHAIFLGVGVLVFALVEGPAKGLVDAIEKIQTLKDVQDPKLNDLLGKLLVIKKRALLLQDLLSCGRYFLAAVAAAVGQSTFFATIPPEIAKWLIASAYSVLLAMMVATSLIQRWRMTAETLRESIRVFCLRRSKEMEQARSFLMAQANQYVSPSEQPTLAIISALSQAKGESNAQ